jgi:DNA helicase-2/ATP-dependent DNA helicase PcrA
MITLDPNQAKAVKFNEDKHLLVLAGAGSGKTRVIIERIKYLISQGVDKSKIAVMTFTKKAALEIQERSKDISNDTEKESIFAGTFHSFALKMINSYEFFKSDANKRVIDRDDQIWLAQICLEELGLSGYLANNLVSKISYAKNIMLPIESYLEKFYPEQSKKDKIIKACKLYESKKETSGYLDYDDLMVHFLNVLKNNQKARDVICSNYSHLLVDEMQDTNPLQWNTLEQYAKYIKLFFVGDDTQSIYAFRGADFKNVHQFTKKLQPSKIIQLSNNYRSTKEILDLSNELLKRSTYNYNKNLISVRGEGKEPKIYNFYSKEDEAVFVVDYILKKEKNHDAKPPDFMVLVRSGFNAKTLEKTFILNKIPYIFIGG